MSDVLCEKQFKTAEPGDPALTGDDRIRLEDAILDRFAMSAYQTRQWL